jgi:hypothetical protein
VREDRFFAKWTKNGEQVSGIASREKLAVKYFLELFKIFFYYTSGGLKV